jgi:hypothetical protein
MPTWFMQPEEQASATTWVVAGLEDAVSRLDPLIAAHRLQRPVREVVSRELTGADLQDAAALLVIGEARRTPGSSLPGVFIKAEDGRRIPAGWLPDIGERLDTYARAAAEVQLRSVRHSARGPFILLGELDERALDTVERVAAQMPGDAPLFHWTADRLPRQDLVSALQCGPGAAFYFGHATGWGWSGYAGFDKADAALATGNALGAILTISCSSATRQPPGLSFCEEIALCGLCAAALGASRKTLHHQNVKLGIALAQGLASGGIETLARLLLATPVSPHILARYRIIGDPLAPLIGHPESCARAEAVFAPAPDAILPVVPLCDWGYRLCP